MQPSIKKNYFYDVFYKIFAMITPLITAPYLSRVLGSEGIGTHSYIQTISYYFALIGCLGISSYGSREISRNREDKTKVTKLFIELQLVKVTIFIFVLIAYVVLISLSGNNSIYYLIFIMSIFANIFDITWFFSGLEKFRTVSIKNTVFRVLQVILILTLVKGSNALIIYMIIYAGTELVSALSLWAGLRSEVVRVDVKKIQLKQHYKETLVYFIPTIATTVYCSVDKVMLKWIIDSSAVGYYEQAKKITSLMETLIFSLNSVMTVRMSLLFKENKIDEMKDGINKSFNFMTLLTLPMMFGISAISNKFVPLFFGIGYDAVVYLIPLMSPLVFIVGISNILGSQYLTPSGQRARSSKAILIGMITNLILNAILIPLIGIYGAVISSIIAEVAVTSIYIYMSKSVFKVTTILVDFIKRLLAASFMFVMVYWMGLYLSTTILAVLLQIFVGVIIYAIVLFILKDKLLIENFKKILCYLFKKKKKEEIMEENKSIDKLKIKIKLDDTFFKEEVRSGYKVSSIMKKVWAVELDLLAELDRVCKKYNIKYFLEAGTLLGAIRHNGFIPWDDDIDIGMMREDYDKLIHIALTKDEFKEPYFLQCAYNDINYTHGHAQLRNSYTTAILKYEEDCNIQFNQGIFIDIFVFDTIPDDVLDKDKQNKKLKKIDKQLYRRYNTCFIDKEKNIIKKIIKKIYRTFSKIGHSLNKDFEKLEKLLRSTKEGKYVDAIMYRFRNDEYQIDKEKMDKCVEHNFEGFSFPVPAEYDYLLKLYFGEQYMTPKQVPNEHGGIIFDPDVSYKKYKNKKKH